MSLLCVWELKYIFNHSFLSELKEQIGLCSRTVFGMEPSQMSFLFFLMYATAAGGLLPLLETTSGSGQELKVKVCSPCPEYNCWLHSLFYKKIMENTLHFSTNKYCTLAPQNCLHISLNLCMSKHKAILYPLCIIDWGCLTWSCGSYWIFLFSCSLLKLRLCAIYISVLFHLSLVSVLQGVQKGLRPKKDEHRCSKQMMIMLIGYRHVC